jgi:hypothetical protein
MEYKFTFEVRGIGSTKNECLDNALASLNDYQCKPLKSELIMLQESENIMDSLSILWTCPECKGLMISDMDNLEQVGNGICPDCEVEMEIKKVSIEEKN